MTDSLVESPQCPISVCWERATKFTASRLNDWLEPSEVDTSVTTKTMETSYDITSEILEKALLLNVETGMWSGKTSQDENDEAARGATTDADIFTKGQKLLVPKKSLDPFVRQKSRMVKFMSRNARKFYIRSTWVVNRDDREKISAEMAKFEAEWNDLGEKFIENYPANKVEMIAMYQAKYPTLVDHIEAQYPTEAQIRSKVKLHWTFGSWGMAQVEEAKEEIEANFRKRANSYLDELENEIYVSSVQAAVEMAKAMDVKSGEINEKKIEKFKGLIQRIRGDNSAFLNSERINEFLNSVDQNMLNVSGWQAEGDAKNKIKECLVSYIDNASHTAEAAAAASVYVRRVHAPVEIEEVEVIDKSATIRRVASTVESEAENSTEETELAEAV